jgi:predicted nucleotidyltransferase
MIPSTTQRLQIAEIAQRYHLGMVLLFGSSLTGQTHPRSDLDIAVRIEGEGEGMGYREYSDLLLALQGVFPEVGIDLAFINHADPLFLKRVTENALLLYGDPRQFLELQIYAYKRYQDHRRYLAMERAYVDQFVKGMAVSR